MATRVRGASAIVQDWASEKGQLVGYFQAVLEAGENSGSMLASMARKTERLNEIFTEAEAKRNTIKIQSEQHPKQRKICCFTSIDSALFAAGIVSLSVATLTNLNVPYMKEVGIVLAACSHLFSKYNDYKSSQLEKKQEVMIQHLEKREEVVDLLNTRVLSQKFFLDLMKSATASLQELYTKVDTDEDFSEQEEKVRFFKTAVDLDESDSQLTGSTVVDFDAPASARGRSRGKLKALSFNALNWIRGVKASKAERAPLLGDRASKT